MAGVVRTQTYQTGWKDVDEIHVNISGGWKEVDMAWSKQNGVWEVVFVRPDKEVLLNNANIEAINPISGGATAGFRLNSNGDAEAQANPPSASWQTISNQWRQYDYGRSYECYATVVSGTFSTGTFGSWLALSTTRTWTLTVGSSEFETAVMDVDIREVGGSTLYTGRITLEAGSGP